MKFTFHTDPSHGWLQVSVQAVKEAGITVSAYSYTDGQYVYLEEDCDAPAYFTALTGGFAPDAWGAAIVEKHTNGESFIRNLPRYIHHAQGD